MPTFKFMARWNGVSGLPEDVYENVLYYEVTQAESAYEIISDGIVAAFNTWGKHGSILGAEVRTYQINGGQPLYSKTYSYDWSLPSGPGEVAVCLSYASSATWDASTKRRRGRLFLGPLANGIMQGERPSTALVTATMTLGGALAGVGAGSGANWMVYSQTDAVATEIRSISVDNAWDTQRRRGLSPTERSVAAV